MTPYDIAFLLVIAVGTTVFLLTTGKPSREARRVWLIAGVTTAIIAFAGWPTARFTGIGSKIFGVMTHAQLAQAAEKSARTAFGETTRAAAEHAERGRRAASAPNAGTIRYDYTQGAATYTGEMYEGVPHGYGQSVFDSGTVLSGYYAAIPEMFASEIEYANGDHAYYTSMRNSGVITYADGRVYAGEVKLTYNPANSAELEPHGLGSEYDRHGRPTRQGQWENGKLIRGKIIEVKPDVDASAPRPPRL